MDVVFVRLPEVPVMVIVAVPVVAVLLAVSVKVLVLVALLGLNEAVTPLGRPEADKLTLELKPFCGVTVMVLVPLAPWVTAKELGLAERVKFGGAETVRERAVAFDRLPEVPVTVSVTVPVAAVLAADSVSVLELVVLLGAKEAVTPLGRPEADKLTLELKPFCGVTAIVLVPLVPCTTVRLPGVAESEKFGGGATGMVIETLSKVAVVRAEVLPLLTARPK
jgi:hypothetical protein